MIREITIPKIGYTMEEGKVVRIIKKPGEEVKAGETILEIESDKATTEINAETDGIILKILAQEGDLVPVLQTVVVMGDAGDIYEESAEEKTGENDTFSERSGEPATQVAAEPITARSSGNRISPRARKILQENGIDESTIALGTGSGYNGMFVERDAIKFISTEPDC